MNFKKMVYEATSSPRGIIEEVRKAMMGAETFNFRSVGWGDFYDDESIDSKTEKELDGWYGRVVEAVIRAIKTTR